MSVRASMSRSPIACSGLMYVGVPSDIPVSRHPRAAGLLTASAMPKSATSALPVVEQNVLGLDVAVDHAVRCA